MEDGYFLSILVIVSSVTICGTQGVFSVGLIVSQVRTTHLCSVFSAATTSFYYIPTDLNETVSAPVILLAP